MDDPVPLCPPPPLAGAIVILKAEVIPNLDF
jgi:hypothetical protein